MPDYRLDPNDYLKNYQNAYPAQRVAAQKRGLAAQQSGTQAAKQAVQPGQPSLSQISRTQGLPTAVGTGLRRGLTNTAQAVGQGLSQGYNAFAYPFRQTRQAYGQLGSALFGLGQQPPTDSGVNAGQGAGVVVPQTQTQPEGQPSLATGATTATPSLTMRPSARQAETQSMAALANYQATPSLQGQPTGPAFQRTQSNAIDGVVGGASAITRYQTPQGFAEFRGEPARAPGNFSGQLTDAAARKAAVTNLGLQDESQLTYDAFGNINNRAQALNSLADTMRQNRLQNRLGNHQFSQADQNAAFNELQGNQQAAAEQATLAQQQQQNDFQNSLAYRGMLRQEADTQSQIASRRQSAEQQKQEASAFSEKSLSQVAAEAAKSGLASPAQALFQYATSLGGLYNPKTGTVFTPSELQADAEQAGVPFEQYYQQLLANYQSLLGEA